MVTMVQTLCWGVQLGKNMVRGRRSPASPSPESRHGGSQISTVHLRCPLPSQTRAPVMEGLRLP